MRHDAAVRDAAVDADPDDGLRAEGARAVLALPFGADDDIDGLARRVAHLRAPRAEVFVVLVEAEIDVVDIAVALGARDRDAKGHRRARYRQVGRRADAPL